MDITPIINALIAVIMAIVTAFLVPWIKTKTTAQERNELIAWVKIGVAAAEQIFKGSGRGAEKKTYVLQFLKDNGFSVDNEVVNNAVNNAIEAAVKQLNSEGINID